MSIKYVCHISDLHIRAGIDTLDPKITRFTEYEIVFKRIITFLKNLNYTNMIICITGDIVHDKRKAGATCINLVNTFINQLADIAPVYIIRGNHDYDQASLTKQDMLSSYMSGFSKNVTYLNTTGVYVTNNVCFGVVAIQDVLKQGNTFGRVETLPEFPDVSKMPSDLIKIALFHGDVPKTYPLEWISSKGYDYLLLGDLHNMQIYGSNVIYDTTNANTPVFKIASYPKKSKSLMWGYPGSTIQQNFGESILGHGFIMWNLENQIADFYHVANDYGFITVNSTTTIQSPSIWFPKKVRVRAKAPGIISTLQEAGFIIEGTSYTSGVGADATQDSAEGPELSEEAITMFNKPEIWCDYILNTVDPEKLVYKKWSDWMTSPNSLIMNNMPFVSNDLIERNKKIQASLDDYNKTVELINSGIVNHSKFSLCYMNWSFILCFKQDCYFDFKALNGQVHCISGRNGFGKTSWLETICIALFGEGFPSRANKHYSASIIYMGKPTGSRAFTSIIFELDEQKYRVTRFFEKQQQNKLHSKDITLEKMVENGDHELIHSGKLATQAWIKKNLGTIQSFLTSCIMTQSCDEDFFMRNSVMQKTYLDQQLRLESSTAFADLLKTASLAYDDINKKLNNIYEFKKSEMELNKFKQSELDESVCKLDKITQEFDVLDARFKELKESWISVNERILSKGKDALQSEFNQLQQSIGIQDLETLIQQRAIAVTNQIQLKELETKYGSYEALQNGIESPEADKLNALIKEQKVMLLNSNVEHLRIDSRYSSGDFNPQCAVCMSWKKRYEESENISEQVKKEWKKFRDIAAIKNIHKTHDISILDEKIANIRRLKELENALQVIDTYVECNKIAKAREALYVEQIECKQTIKTLLANKHSYENAQKTMTELAAHCDKFNELSTTIKAVLSEFVKFKDWVLEEKVMPVMLSNVNKLLETMCFNHRSISLQCIFENGGGLNWRICDGSHVPPIEKASGFQKFVVGLAMRIVLGRLGVAGIKNTQLFIDEGFTACDTLNLCNVPDVLNKLLELYSSVIIVTHLDELKNEIRSFINIDRDEEDGSRIQFGVLQNGGVVKKKKTRAIPCKNMDRQKVETCD